MYYKLLVIGHLNSLMVWTALYQFKYLGSKLVY